MKRVVFVSCIFLLVLGCNRPTNAQDVVFGWSYDKRCVVVGNTVKYYYHDGNSWGERPNMEFTLK